MEKKFTFHLSRFILSSSLALSWTILVFYSLTAWIRLGFLPSENELKMVEMEAPQARQCVRLLNRRSAANKVAFLAINRLDSK